MKKLILIIILIAGGYFLLKGGLGGVIQKLDVNPNDIVSNITEKVIPGTLPEVAPERKGLNASAPHYIKVIKNNIFMTYDPALCFALVDMYYSSGYSDSLGLILEYIKMFDLPEDKARVLILLGRYRDQQTFDIMKNLYDQNIFTKTLLLKKMAVFHSRGAALLIKQEMQNPDEKISETANDLAKMYKEEPWFKNAVAYENDNGAVGDIVYKK